MQLEGKSKEHKGMRRFDQVMRMKFGEDINLTSYYGPVQMCVFGLTYKYIPMNYMIEVECERGFITLSVKNDEGQSFSPWMIYPESRYYHFEDNEKDVIQLIELVYKAINNQEIIFMNDEERLKLFSGIKFVMRLS